MITRRKFVGLLAGLPGASYVAAVQDSRITHAKIHPAIGVARVGNSRDEYFIGPEVADEPPLPVGQYKDATGAIKRQAAQFRVYGYNAAGEVVRELTANNAVIAWTVHLANKKSAWYEFHLPFDIPEAAQSRSARHNAGVTGADRRKLIIDPGPRTIQGKSTRGAAYQFDGGRFFDLPVPLGELRTAAAGQLLVLGGFGLSRSLYGQPPATFANNNGWHDDTSDGPVDAKVSLDGREIPVEGAWVVVAPPNFAPGLKTVRTMYDLLYDRLVAWNLAALPATVSFSRHIAPIFRRLTGLQWVSRGLAEIHGFGSSYDANQIMNRLADPSPANEAFRKQIYAQFRNPAENRLGQSLWPVFYGDAVDSFGGYYNRGTDPTLLLERGMSRLADTQLGWLKLWAGGNFTNDLLTTPVPPKTLKEVQVRDQPAALDEAALAFCLADAFHPGCELTWIMRRRQLYGAALRIRRRPDGAPEPDYGAVLTAEAALADTGPLSGSGPGDLTRWMAIPWQTDTADCLWSYPFFRFSPELPSYWPARVPNEVLSEADYRTALDAAETLAVRQAAFATRRNWFRGLRQNDKFAHMVSDFHKLGIIEERPGPSGVAQLPRVMLVESRPDLPLPEDNQRGRGRGSNRGGRGNPRA